LRWGRNSLGHTRHAGYESLEQSNRLHSRSRIAILDYLRLSAAICVCISHVLGALRETNHILKPLNYIFGYTVIFRVPLLFMISGFVVYLSINGKPQTYSAISKFLFRRWTWITVPLCLALSFTYCYEKLLWIGGFPHVPQRTLVDVISNVLCITSFTNTRRWIDPTWSLAFELQFYVVIALIWIMSLKMSSRPFGNLRSQVLILGLVFASIVVDRLYQVESFGTWHFRWFALGLVAGMRFSNIDCNWLLRASILIVGTTSIVEGGGYLAGTKLVLLAGVLLFVETSSFVSINKSLQSSPVFGTISYLIYLFHWPIASHSGALVQLCRRLSLEDDYWPLFAILIPVGVSVLLAKPVYRLCNWVTSILLAKNASTSLPVA
jgi:peptidoglycan/LPS O-acetylase OafA/YrhL